MADEGNGENLANELEPAQIAPEENKNETSHYSNSIITISRKV